MRCRFHPRRRRHGLSTPWGSEVPCPLSLRPFGSLYFHLSVSVWVWVRSRPDPRTVRPSLGSCPLGRGRGAGRGVPRRSSPWGPLRSGENLELGRGVTDGSGPVRTSGGSDGFHGRGTPAGRSVRGPSGGDRDCGSPVTVPVSESVPTSGYTVCDPDPVAASADPTSGDPVGTPGVRSVTDESPGRRRWTGW